MDQSIKVYWILLSMGSYATCGHCIHFISNSNSKQVVEGRSLNLTCHISSPLVHCVWLHSNKEVLYPSPNYAMFGNQSNGECHLSIENVEPETDKGLWTCQMITANKINISHEINLTVLPRDYVRVESDSKKIHPGVIIGACCAFMFTVGGLIVMYLYKKNSSCFLAPAGYTSRSMLIWDTSPTESGKRTREMHFENSP